MTYDFARRSVVRLATTTACAVLLLAACGTDAGSSASRPSAGGESPSDAQSASETAGSTASAETGLEALPAPEITDIVMANVGTPSANSMHSIIAQHLDLPAKYGLNIEWNEFQSAAEGAQALFAEQAHVSDNASGPAVASLPTDDSLLLTYVTRHNLTDILFGQPDVETAEDLRGGSVAISSFGAQSHAGVLVALDALGLAPDDVTITQVGNDSARLAALQAGSVNASINDATQEDQLAELGLNVLVRLADVEDGGIVRTGLLWRRDFVEQYPNTVLNLTAMYAEANTLWREDPEMSAEALADAADMSLEDATRDIEAVLSEPWEPLDGRCDPDVMEFTRLTLLPEIPALADVNPAEACTNEFIDQLVEMGVFEEIGVPGY